MSAANETNATIEPKQAINVNANENSDKNGQKSLDVKIIRVGSRKSELALIQTRHVISTLKKLHPDQKFEIHTMTTMGDRILNISLPKIGEKSLFTKDLEDALKNGVVDFVVHSLKDLPTCLPDGMAIGAVLEREDPRDALVLAKQHEGKCLKTLPEGSIIGTSSLRRTAQISRLYPNLKVHDIRGNLNTRLAKLDAPDSKFAGIVLAQAGLVRMGWQHRISQTIDPDDILYAVGQGALAVECRSTDANILRMLQQLTCLRTQCRILTERSFLKTLGGGCSAPVAVNSTLAKRKFADTDEKHDHELEIIGSVWSLDGNTEIQATNACRLNLEGKSAHDDDENESSIPTKKIKLSVEIGGNDIVEMPPKLSPPQVVDHSKLLATNINELNSQNLDIAGLINTHNDAFKKCPYAAKLANVSSPSQEITSNVPQTSSHSDQQLKCPLSFIVGQDVMGQCPYVDTCNQTFLNQTKETESKSTTIATNSCVTCPFKNATAGSDSTCAEKSTENSIETKCPFGKDGKLTTETVSKCPFLTAQISSRSEENEVICNERAIQTLFCGLYPHKCWPLELFNRCEQLGKDLAAQLIEKGALSVMEAAQNEIRKKA